MPVSVDEPRLRTFWFRVAEAPREVDLALFDNTWFQAGIMGDPRGALKEAALFAAARVQQQTGPARGQAGPPERWVFLLRADDEYWQATARVACGCSVGHPSAPRTLYTRLYSVQIEAVAPPT